ncbi:hypothetical protein Nepgr_021422 [Nepenthes gracilis]|uniref:Uncharacterized protein n=1 Tax=Nepenthes gracilis TaxID=150966 RepID=A0AAD3T0X9_NEPGR|nr:hypothetical protein Nepgr_021422 [Nepenthes gracilis]
MFPVIDHADPWVLPEDAATGPCFTAPEWCVACGADLSMDSRCLDNLHPLLAGARFCYEEHDDGGVEIAHLVLDVS